MKTHTIFILILFLTFAFVQFTMAQGCVAIRNMGCSGANIGGSPSALFQQGDWQASLNYRYFRSYRHFRGREEEVHRVQEGTEVINIFNSADIGLSYGISNRLSLLISLPVIMNDRSSMYEHYGNSVAANPDRGRFHTHSAGIGDLRLSANYWLIDPAAHSKGNLALGLGIKAPTGNANVQGNFHKLDEKGENYTIRRAVDQSIQLGDGGWGFSVEVQGFQALWARTALYISGFYLFNPRNINNTLRNVGLDPADSYSYLSVPDQYAARLGLSYFSGENLSLSIGVRVEGIPTNDAIGQSDGFRRPGYIVSAEPGIAYLYKQMAFNLNVPVALVRNRTRNTRDIATNRHGDAAFADYLVNAGVVWRFSKEHNATFKKWEDLKEK